MRIGLHYTNSNKVVDMQPPLLAKRPVLCTFMAVFFFRGEGAVFWSGVTRLPSDRPPPAAQTYIWGFLSFFIPLRQGYNLCSSYRHAHRRAHGRTRLRAVRLAYHWSSIIARVFIVRTKTNFFVQMNGCHRFCVAL